MRVRFGDFVLDRATRQLWKSGELRPLEPKAYALLDLLISRRPDAVSKQEIQAGLWPDTFVSESHLSSLAAQVRRALDAGPKGPSFVRTVHGFGYAFGAEATEEEKGHGPARAGAQAESASQSRKGSGGARLLWEKRAFSLEPGENIVGRDEDLTVCIDAPGVSRRHARIVVDAGQAMLEDLGSKNGTYLRERRLDAPTVLSDGDTFRLGRQLLVYRSSSLKSSTMTEG